MTKRYLVTGGTGFLGSALVKGLLQTRYSVRVLDNNSRGSLNRLDGVLDQVEFVEGDICHADVVEKAVQGVDAVCHLAYINGTRYFYEKPALVLDVGVREILNVIDACLKHGVGELILVSSSEVYQTPPTVPTDETVPLSIPDPLNPRYSYGAGKIISEIMAINYGRLHFERVVICRPHNVYGPQMGWEHVVPQFILRMAELTQRIPTGIIPFPIQGSGHETRSFVYIEDFTDGLMRLVEKGEHLGIYHVGTMEELSIAEVAQAVGDYFERQVEIVPGPGAAGGTVRRCPDIKKIITLGYTPRYSFREGLTLTAKWYIENAFQAPRSALS